MDDTDELMLFCPEKIIFESENIKDFFKEILRKTR